MPQIPHNIPSASNVILNISKEIIQGTWNSSKDNVLSTKPDELSLIPGTYMMKGENCLLQIAFKTYIYVKCYSIYSYTQK